jgi:aspartate-semialdehyde dehydrogenase
VQGLRVAVIGATGLVGQTILRILEERAHIPVRDLVPLATEGQGRTVSFQGRAWAVHALAEQRLAGIDVAFFAATNAVSEEWAPRAVAAGAVVVDKSSHFRLDPAIPLVVPEVNGHVLKRTPGIIASPNCSTIQLVMALAPIRRHRRLERVLVSTYQAVSGSGREAMDQLSEETAAWVQGAQAPPPRVYPAPIAGNVLPHCDRFGEGGFTGEEWKLMRETNKILDEAIPLSATAVRVPVMVGHAESVYVELDRPAAVEEVRAWVGEFPGVRLYDDPVHLQYPTPRLAAGNDWVWVGRIRQDPHEPRGVHLFVVSDNLRKGAASNAVDIVERVMAMEA